MSKRAVGIVAVVLFLLFVGCILFSAAALALSRGSGRLWVGNKVAVIYVQGVIVSGDRPTGAMFSSERAYADEIVRFLRKADSRRDIQAIVMRVDSPGGGVVASDEIYRAMRKVHKPIVVSMGSLAASGGYYISCAAREIVANPNTLTGSIGVITILPNVQGLLDRLGIKMIVLASGPHKEEGTFRPFTEEDRAIWDSIIQDTYDNFVQVVAEGRKMDEARVRELADGRIYTGDQALRLGLVDRLGTMDLAVERAAQLGGIRGKPHLVPFRSTPTLLEALFGAALPHPSAQDLADRLGLSRPFTVQYLYLGR
jgi:protease-4